MVLTALSISCNASSLSPQFHDKLTHQSKMKSKGFETVESLLQARGVSSTIKTSPLQSLQNGNWVKLICGASFEDVVDVRNLSLVYTLAGVDCIDCAADGSVLNAVNEGIEAARAILPLQRPWVMISVNDHEDLHFRKAQFDPDDCPLDCSRPCEKVCPANAIVLTGAVDEVERGVVTERCYGCGRCFPVCPYDKIIKRHNVKAIESSIGDQGSNQENSREDNMAAEEERERDIKNVLAVQMKKGLIKLTQGTNKQCST